MNRFWSKFRGYWIILAVMIMTFYFLIVLIFNRDQGRPLATVSEELDSLMMNVRSDLVADGVFLTEIEHTDRLDCRSGLNKRDGTFQNAASFRTSKLTDAEAAVLFDRIANILEKRSDNNVIKSTHSTSDIDYSLRLEQPDKTVSVIRASEDRSISVGASTDCLRP